MKVILISPLSLAKLLSLFPSRIRMKLPEEIIEDMYYQDCNDDGCFDDWDRGMQTPDCYREGIWKEAQE